jgi:diacylglycerol kinase
MEKKESKKILFRDRIESVIYALNGLKILLKEEYNSRIHATIAITVIIAGFLLNISNIEWLIIWILIGMVFSLEIINSAIENLCDHITPQWNETIKKIKDLAAAAVFVASVISVICGAIIFLPKLCDLFL